MFDREFCDKIKDMLKTYGDEQEQRRTKMSADLDKLIASVNAMNKSLKYID